MKLLLWYTDKFAYTPTLKTLPDVENAERGQTYKNSLIAFVHVEEDDEAREASVKRKFLKLLKWAAKKNETTNIVLHSFAHLSESKASTEFTRALFNGVEERLINAGYHAVQTPFGYFLDLEMQAPGKPSARIFKSIE